MKWNEYKKSYSVSIVIIAIIIIYFLLNVDAENSSPINRVIFNYADNSKDFINNLLISIITGLITILAVIITNEHTKKLNEANKQREKEIAYRSINKQNEKVIIREIMKFYGNACYIDELYLIERKYKIYGIFNYEYSTLKSLNESFLKKLKEDFYYDSSMVERIEEILQGEVGTKEYFESCKSLFKLLYGFSDETNKNIEFIKFKRKARLELYSMCRFSHPKYKYLKEQVNLSLNNNYMFEIFIALDVEDRNNILSLYENIYSLNKYVPTDYDQFKRIMAYQGNESYPILVQRCRNLFNTLSDYDIDIQIFYTYNGLYGKINNKDLYNNYGSPKEEYKEIFLESIQLEVLEHIPASNETYQNIEPYHYL